MKRYSAFTLFTTRRLSKQAANAAASHSTPSDSLKAEVARLKVCVPWRERERERRGRQGGSEGGRVCVLWSVRVRVRVRVRVCITKLKVRPPLMRASYTSTPTLLSLSLSLAHMHTHTYTHTHIRTHTYTHTGGPRRGAEGKNHAGAPRHECAAAR